MKKIETSNTELLQVLTDNGISIICDNDMQMTISDEDASKIDDIVSRFAPAATYDYVLTDIKAGKEFSLKAGDNNSIFVWSSAFAKSFAEMPEVINDMIVVITNAHHTHVTIYNVKGFSDEDIECVIERHCSLLTIGCSYKYELIKKIGNCYFVN